MSVGGWVRGGEALPYREAIRRLAEAGYGEVDKGLYVESLAAHLERLAAQPPAAGDQLVRARPAEEDEGAGDPPPVVRISRVQRAGGREYEDDIPFATVRRTAQQPGSESPDTGSTADGGAVAGDRAAGESADGGA